MPFSSIFPRSWAQRGFGRKRLRLRLHQTRTPLISAIRAKLRRLPVPNLIQIWCL
uniref:Uncharacterized protein n=1 Tax=Lepeophtheirus salmonis TaxID=72036 RepID=A0A0K2VGX9_LEPSM